MRWEDREGVRRHPGLPVRVGRSGGHGRRPGRVLDRGTHARGSGVLGRPPGRPSRPAGPLLGRGLGHGLGHGLVERLGAVVVDDGEHAGHLVGRGPPGGERPPARGPSAGSSARARCARPGACASAAAARPAASARHRRSRRRPRRPWGAVRRGGRRRWRSRCGGSLRGGGRTSRSWFLLSHTYIPLVRTQSMRQTDGTQPHRRDLSHPSPRRPAGPGRSAAGRCRAGAGSRSSRTPPRSRGSASASASASSVGHDVGGRALST